MKEKILELFEKYETTVYNPIEATSQLAIENTKYEVIAQEIVKLFAIPDVIKPLPEYNEILYHAKTLTDEQFREYWNDVQGNVL